MGRYCTLYCTSVQYIRTSTLIRGLAPQTKLNSSSTSHFGTVKARVSSMGQWLEQWGTCRNICFLPGGASDAFPDFIFETFSFQTPICIPVLRFEASASRLQVRSPVYKDKRSYHTLIVQSSPSPPPLLPPTPPGADTAGFSTREVRDGYNVTAVLLVS